LPAPFNLSQALGGNAAAFGFTDGTLWFTAIHDILNWAFQFVAVTPEDE
jgi:hypothetical protein